MDSTFGRITVVDIGGGKLIPGLTSAFYHLFVGVASFIVHYFEVNVVAAACQPFHYGVVLRDTVFVVAPFLGCV